MKRLNKYFSILLLTIAFSLPNFLVTQTFAPEGIVSIAEADDDEGGSQRNREQRQQAREERRQQRQQAREERRERQQQLREERRQQRQQAREERRACRRRGGCRPPPTVSEFPIQYMIPTGIAMVMLFGGITYLVQKRNRSNSKNA